MKPGFTLLEFLLATALAGLLSVFLLTSLWSINRYVYLIDETTQMDEKAALINSQIERSISGAFIPVQAIEEKKEPEQQKPVSAEQAQAAASVEKKEETKRPTLKKIFFSENKEKNLSVLTCITNNPLVVYWGEQWGKAVPRIARVVYRLKPEKVHDKRTINSFTLARQESDELDFAAFDKSRSIKSYDLARGIKSFTVEFGLVESEKEKQETKKFDQWNSDATSSEKEEEKKSPLPTFLKITYELWDNQYKRSQSYTYLIYIVGGQPAPAPKSPEKKPEEKKSNLIEMMHKQVFPQQAPPQKN